MYGAAAPVSAPRASEQAIIPENVGALSPTGGTLGGRATN
jgi:hypothetical protein